jgi:hypothetical protein
LFQKKKKKNTTTEETKGKTEKTEIEAVRDMCFTFTGQS